MRSKQSSLTSVVERAHPNNHLDIASGRRHVGGDARQRGLWRLSNVFGREFGVFSRLEVHGRTVDVSCRVKKREKCCLTRCRLRFMKVNECFGLVKRLTDLEIRCVESLKGPPGQVERHLFLPCGLGIIARCTVPKEKEFRCGVSIPTKRVE